jgi:hypothetical protein
MLHNLICKWCSKPFSSITFRQRFCSRSCNAKYGHSIRSIKEKQNHGYCKKCQKPLYNYDQQIFCCQSCAAIYNNKKRRLLGPKTDEQKMKISCSLKEYNRIHPNSQRKKKTLQERTLCYVSFCTICSKCIPTLTKRPKKSCSANCLFLINQQNGKKNAAKRVKRSKDEIKLFNLCSSYFEKVQHNVPIIDGWDADIILPDHKIAILWNGPWHYKQLPLKNHSLLQVQTRDKIKTEILKENGWQVMIFEDRYYTPNTAFEQIKMGAEGVSKPTYSRSL